MRTSWNEKRYYSLDYYLKETFGEKIYRIALNGGMTCPNRDGTLDTRGCIFCSSGGSGDFAGNPLLSITDQIEAGKNQLQKKTNCKHFVAYFQAFTNTYAPIDYLERIFTEAINSEDIVALSIGTRPDCLDKDVVALLNRLNKIKPVWIELGLQTIHPDTNAFIRSSFTYECFLTAINDLKKANINVIVHLILGLPGETKKMMLQSVQTVSKLPVDGLKLQLLHILKGTDLAEFYQESPFPVFTMESYIEFVIDCLEYIPQNIVIHRLTGDGPRNLLIEPTWSTDKKRVLNQIQKRLKELNTYQGRLFHN